MKDDDRKFTTTDAGILLSSDEYSLTVGPDGPSTVHKFRQPKEETI
jgi:catalase